MQIEQIDRDAAAEEVYEASKGGLSWCHAKSMRDRIRDGQWDIHPTVKRFAAHRLAAQPPVTDADVERVAKRLYETDDCFSADFPWPNVDGDNSGLSADHYRKCARAVIAAYRGE